MWEFVRLLSSFRNHQRSFRGKEGRSAGIWSVRTHGGVGDEENMCWREEKMADSPTHLHPSQARVSSCGRNYVRLKTAPSEKDAATKIPPQPFHFWRNSLHLRTLGHAPYLRLIPNPSLLSMFFNSFIKQGVVRSQNAPDMFKVTRINYSDSTQNFTKISTHFTLHLIYLTIKVKLCLLLMMLMANCFSFFLHKCVTCCFVFRIMIVFVPVCVCVCSVVPITEASVIIGVSSPRRSDSLEAVKFGIDALKSSVPIWKKVRLHVWATKLLRSDWSEGGA